MAERKGRNDPAGIQKTRRGFIRASPRVLKQGICDRAV